MFETVRDILIHTTEESMVILLALSCILFVFLVAYWQYNRRRFQKLSHQIPARVVKDYLDSVIENSAALKSSLFLGEDGQGASVVPIDKLPGGHDEGPFRAELSRKNAEIAELRNSISVKDKIITELEGKLLVARGGSGEPSVMQSEIEQLNATVEHQQLELSAGKDELEKITEERDSLRDMLKEYEVIEDDLSKLKSLQEENERYREKEEAAPPEVPPVEDTMPDIPSEESTRVQDKKEKNEKEKDDSEALLKEFEKMLG